MVQKTKKRFWEHFSVAKATDKYIISLYVLLVVAFIARVIHLNYNSAFNDEAIYIVIGRMGLFASDWWSYGAKLWMAGLPYIYPPLAALSYELGGLSGARLLNVIFGIFLIEEVYRFTKLLNLYDDTVNKRAGLIAAFLVAFSGVGIFVSKLATYDMPSFLLMMMGINSFLKAKYYANGKYYFLSFLCIFVAFLTKIIIAVFFPILFLLSILVMKGRSLDHRKKAIFYLYVPFFIVSLVYFIFYSDNLGTYVGTHKNIGETFGYSDILTLIWRELMTLLVLIIPASLVLVATRKIKVLASLALLIIAIPAFHLVLLRLATLDKHLYLPGIFLSVVIGYGVSVIISNKNKFVALGGTLGFSVFLAYYLMNSYSTVLDLEHNWSNTYALQSFLESRVKPGDKVLTQEGGVVVLALYDKIFPPKSIVTFDWIDYSGVQDDSGYAKAVSDTYFDYIEISGKRIDGGSLGEKVVNNLSNNYVLAYNQGDFRVYEKKK